MYHAWKSKNAKKGGGETLQSRVPVSLQNGGMYVLQTSFQVFSHGDHRTQGTCLRTHAHTKALRYVCHHAIMDAMVLPLYSLP